MIGAAVSGGAGGFTVTIKDDVAELPVASIAVQSTRVSPIMNSEPEDGSIEIAPSPPSLSLRSKLGLQCLVNI